MTEFGHKEVVFLNVALDPSSMTLRFLDDLGAPQPATAKPVAIDPGTVVCWRFVLSEPLLPDWDRENVKMSNPWRRLSPMVWFESFAAGVGLEIPLDGNPLGRLPGVDQDPEDDDLDLPRYWGPFQSLTQATFQTTPPKIPVPWVRTAVVKRVATIYRDKLKAQRDDLIKVGKGLPKALKCLPELDDLIAPVVWGQVHPGARGVFKYRAVFQSGFAEDVCEEVREGAIPKTMFMSKVGALFVKTPPSSAASNEDNSSLPARLGVFSLDPNPGDKAIFVPVFKVMSKGGDQGSLAETLAVGQANYPTTSAESTAASAFAAEPVVGRTVRTHEAVQWNFMPYFATTFDDLDDVQPSDLPIGWMPSVDFQGMQDESDNSGEKALVNRHFGPFEAMTYRLGQVRAWGQSGVGDSRVAMYEGEAQNVRSHHYRVSMLNTGTGTITEVSSPDPDDLNLGGG